MHTTNEQEVIATRPSGRGRWRLRGCTEGLPGRSDREEPHRHRRRPHQRRCRPYNCVENDYTKVQTRNGHHERGGGARAKLSILDSDGNAVESWISGEEPHRIDRLEPGDYTLVEEMTPNRYDKATRSLHRLSLGQLQTVVMYDEPISITAEIDKRQEIADPVAKDTEANGDGATART